MQEIATFLLGALALGYLVYRRRRRRASKNCCGEPNCPATKGMVERIERLK